MYNPIKTKGMGFCPNCKVKFETDIQLSFISTKDKKNSFPKAMCPICKTQNRIHVQFVFWDYEKNVVYFVFPTNKLNEFHNVLKSLFLIYNDFILELDISDQAKLKAAPIKYTESVLFPAVINKFEPNDFILGFRSLRLTPELTLDIPEDIEFKSNEENYLLLKNDIAFYENGQSELFKELISETKNIINEKHIAVNIKAVKEKQHPTSTLGLAEFLIFIGSNIVLPIVLNLLSNAISKLFKKKKITNDDKLIIKIKKDKSTSTYYFEGPPAEVLKSLDKVSKETLNTLSISSNCHIVPLVDNIVSESNFKTQKTVDNAAKEYIKYFGKNTAVEFTDSKHQEEIISAKAKYLMAKGEYLRAWAIMLPYIDSANTMELMCNYALCLKNLGEIDAANEYYYKVINLYLDCPDLNDLINFVGNYNQVDIDKAYKKVSTLVDEQFSTEEDKKIYSELHNLCNNIYNFDFESLCKEADNILNKLKGKH